MDFSVIYHIKSSVVALFSLTPSPLKSGHHCILSQCTTVFELFFHLLILIARDLKRVIKRYFPCCYSDICLSFPQAGLFNLRMSLEILKDEPEESFEWKIVQGSKDSVKQLEEWVDTVCSNIWAIEQMHSIVQRMLCFFSPPVSTNNLACNATQSSGN